MKMTPKTTKQITKVGLTLLIATTLAGCASSYWRTDKVSPKAGNAVAANLAISTTNPSSKLMNHKHGLGKNGNVIPAQEE